VGGAFSTSSIPLAPGAIALTGGFPGADVLPIAELSAAYTSVLARSDAGINALQYHGPFGTDELRAWIAADQGAEFDQVLVTNGALHSVSFILESLIDPGDTVVVENPTYPFALRLLNYFGAQVLSVDVDAEGADPDALEALLKAGARPKVFYTIPDFHNPTGVTLSGPRRQRIVELAERYGFVIVSDNPYQWLRFAGDRVPDFPTDSPLVVRANTFSKALGPGLRLGWITVPNWLREPVVRARLNADQHAGLLTQRAVTEIVTNDSLFTSILDRARQAYAERSAVLHDALVAALPDRIEAARPDGGLFLWVRVPGVDLRHTLDVARSIGLDFNVGVGFNPDPTLRYTDIARFAYSNATATSLTTAAERFAEAVARSR
jgi:2-aminoadipate transaminase